MFSHDAKWSDACEIVRGRIMHTCDGPVSRFVAIARACELCSKYGDNPFVITVIANVLDDCLTELGESILASSEVSL